MTYLYIAAKFWREVLIGFLAFLLMISLAVLNAKKSDLIQFEAKRQAYIDNQEKLLAQSQADAALKEKQITQKLLDAERNYNVQIKQISADVRAADAAANSLSKQLSEANRRVSTASRETIVEYIDTNSDILKECIAEYREVAEKSDGHAADAKRLSDAWPVIESLVLD